MNNILKFEKNFDYDPSKINGEDGWQYYKYELDGSPCEGSTEDNQRLLISILCQCLNNIGAITKSFSEFDE